MSFFLLTENDSCCWMINDKSLYIRFYVSLPFLNTFDKIVMFVMYSDLVKNKMFDDKIWKKLWKCFNRLEEDEVIHRTVKLNINEYTTLIISNLGVIHLYIDKNYDDDIKQDTFLDKISINKKENNTSIKDRIINLVTYVTTLEKGKKYTLKHLPHNGENVEYSCEFTWRNFRKLYTSF
jgi:hypothetical protein